MMTIKSIFSLFGGKGECQQPATEEKEEKKENGFTMGEPKHDAESQDNGKAHIYNLLIVDESGSMGHLREATLDGINETISTIRSAQREYANTQDHTLTLVTFDSGTCRPDVRAMILNKPILEVGEFSKYSPCGCTPLYDALGQSLTTLHNYIKNDKNATAVVTVLTDGLENASKEWNGGDLRRLIEQLKEEGWSFAYMGSAHNVKEVTDLLAIDNVMEFSHDNLGASNTWERESSSRRAYYSKMDMMFQNFSDMTDEEMVAQKRRYAKEYYEPRVTPDNITELKANEIFVFGSNAHGMHKGGAAALAMKKFGAVWGQGEGAQGRCYAIPTMEGLDSMAEAIDRFTAYAGKHPEQRFLVTRVGCGIAGYTAAQVAPLFKACITLENVSLPSDFWQALGLKNFA